MRVQNWDLDQGPPALLHIPMGLHGKPTGLGAEHQEVARLVAELCRAAQSNKNRRGLNNDRRGLNKSKKKGETGRKERPSHQVSCHRRSTEGITHNVLVL